VESKINYYKVLIKIFFGYFTFGSDCVRKIQRFSIIFIILVIIYSIIKTGFDWKPVDKYEGVYINSDFRGYIYAQEDENIKITLSVYDFSNELEEVDSIELNGNNNINSANFNLLYIDSNDLYERYNLTFDVSISTIGSFYTDDLAIKIITKNKNFTNGFGKWNIEIDKKSENSVSFTDSYYKSFDNSDLDVIPYELDFTNDLATSVDLESMSIQLDTGIQQRMIDTSLLTGENLNYKFDFKGTGSNIYYIKPKLVTTLDGKKSFVSLKGLVYIRELSNDELIKIID
jgi:hypothetical protein